MYASAKAKSDKTDVEIRTRNPVHDCDFSWNIDNATKFARRVNSHKFPEESGCEPRFRLVAKFNEKYPPDISNVNIGVQRVDEGKQMIHVSVDISLVNIKGVVYRNKQLNYSTGGDGSPTYVFSELFTASRSYLKIETSFSSDSKVVITEALKNNLVGSHKHEKEVFFLPHDILAVKGSIKTHGCCVVTHTLEPKQILDAITQQEHVSQLLSELQTSYQEKQFTDVELVVGDHSVHVHRFVLSLRSPVFRKMFGHDTLEKSTGKVELKDFETEVVNSFVWYLYSGEIKEGTWEFMSSMYQIAEKYEVFSLVKACASVLSNLIDRDSVCGILQLADLHQNEILKAYAMYFLKQFFSSVKSTPEWDSIINSNQKLAAEVLSEVSLCMNENVYR